MLALFLKLLKMTKIHRPEKKIQKNTTKEKDDEIKTECEFSRNFFSSLLVWTNKLEKKKIGKQHRSSSEMRKASVFQLEKLKEARFIKNLLFYQWTPKRNKQSLRKNVKKIKKDTNFSCSVSKQKKEKHGKPQNSTQFEKKKILQTCFLCLSGRQIVIAQPRAVLLKHVFHYRSHWNWKDPLRRHFWGKTTRNPSKPESDWYFCH